MGQFVLTAPHDYAATEGGYLRLKAFHHSRLPPQLFVFYKLGVLVRVGRKDAPSGKKDAPSGNEDFAVMTLASIRCAELGLYGLPHQLTIVTNTASRGCTSQVITIHVYPHKEILPNYMPGLR
jgi:hypothetical protein